MKKLTSTQVLGLGFLAILCLLGFCAQKAFELQSAGGEEQRAAYRRFIEQDDAVTTIRRSVWLGGIYSRDYFLDPTAAGRAQYSRRITELSEAATQATQTLRRLSPDVLDELAIPSAVEAFLRELRELADPHSEGLEEPAVFIEKVLIPRRLAMLALMEEFRAGVRQELVDAQGQYDAGRKEAAREMLILLSVAFCLSVLVTWISLRYALGVEQDRRRHLAEISLANQELENLSARVLEIQEDERRALSQELHDEVGQTLTALRMEISHALQRVREPSTRERLGRARELAEKTVQMVRNISLMLRPSLLDDLGLGAALQWQLEQFASRSGVQISFAGAEAGESIPDDVKTCVFRIAQEALNNCEKYAKASTLRVVLRHDLDRISLEVEDNGEGFVLDARGLPPRGTGILGMKERAQKLGGSVTVESTPGEGTKVSLLIPLAAGVAANETLQEERG